MIRRDFSQFISESIAEKQINGKWIVYVDGENKMGKINDCVGTTDFEAKEDAWIFYQELISKLEKIIKHEE